jgi:hypothetical protein
MVLKDEPIPNVAFRNRVGDHLGVKLVDRYVEKDVPWSGNAQSAVRITGLKRASAGQSSPLNTVKGSPDTTFCC